MIYRPGAHVTLACVLPGDPYVLEFQRCGTVTRVTDRGVYFTTGGTFPPDREFGPFPPDRIAPGWLAQNEYA